MDYKNEGWAIDITSKNATHYYKNGISLCNKTTEKFYMSNFDKLKDYTQILGNVCSLCQKKLNKL
jgi:hypothetical protein